jgi:hypothetical protein
MNPAFRNALSNGRHRCWLTHGVLFVLYLTFLALCGATVFGALKRLTVYLAASLLQVASLYIIRDPAQENMKRNTN